jgi:hypothetical protein
MPDVNTKNDDIAGEKAILVNLITIL